MKMNVLSDILCDTSSLMTPQSYKSSSSSENKMMSTQNIFTRPGSLNILNPPSEMPGIERSVSSINHQSSPSSIDLFNPSSHIHITQNENPDFEERSDSIFSDPFAEIVPSWLTHGFMKVSDNLPSHSILSSISDIYPSAQEDEQLEMLDLGFTPDMTSHHLSSHDLNKTNIDEGQKLLSNIPIQQFSAHEPLLLSNINDLNVSHLQMPLKNNLQYHKSKEDVEITNPSNLMQSLLNCENQLVHIPINSDMTNQCLTNTSSPSVMHRSQSHHNSVCDKFPQINMNLNSFLGSEIPEMQLLRQDFPTVNLSGAVHSRSNHSLSNCNSTSGNVLQNTDVVLMSNKDASVQVSCGNSTVSENCNACKKVDLNDSIEIVQSFKCNFCNFISIHKCVVQNHINAIHSKSPVPSGTNLNSTSNTLPQNNLVNSSALTNSQVMSKSNFTSGHNLSSAPVQISIRESSPLIYQLIPMNGVVINSVVNNHNGDGLDKNNPKCLPDDLNNNLNRKQQHVFKMREDDLSSIKKPSEPKKKNCQKSSKEETPSEKPISAKKKGWQKKIKRELGSYICEFKGCNVRFKALDNLEYHRKCHVSGGNAFACPECGMPFDNWRTIAGHLWRNHSNDMELHACDICPFRTYSLSRLENYHKKTHLDECLFLCDTCGKKFKNRKQLRNHRDVHNKKRSTVKRHKVFKCKACLSDFTSKRLLHSHQDLIHNLKRKNFLCSFCDFSSKKKANLDLHMRQHTGEKPFICDKCEYKTADHNSLRRHKMIHTGEKRYTCPYCSYSSIQAHSYKDHVEKKHPGQELIYSCKLCSFRSVKYEIFNMHMEEHDNINKHKIIQHINEMSSNEDILPLVEAMGIRLSNGDCLTNLNNGVNSQSFVNTVNMDMMNICHESSI